MNNEAMRDYLLLCKYAPQSRERDPEDEYYLKKLMAVGLIAPYIDTYKVRCLARTTPLGRKLIKYE